jgi:TonB-dependent starch-binding outer membrane protein SusC
MTQPTLYVKLTFIFILFHLGITAQEMVKVNGEVVAQEDNNAIENASVSLKGTTAFVKTDKSGVFQIDVPKEQMQTAVLLIQYRNYKIAQYKVNGKKNLTIMLTKISTQEDVIVTSSYTKKRKEEVVGSIVTISAKQLQIDRPIESFDKMLEGLAAGVQVQSNTELGTPVKINIRGQNALSQVRGSNSTALTASAQPLFVVDGVPVVEQRRGDEPIAFLNNEQLLNPLAGINPDDIESISILKDAAAASIYGANASNGVVIITTKKGKAGKPRVSFSYSSGINSPFNGLKWLSGSQYQGLLKELYINEGRDPAAAELLAGPSDVSTPWFQLTNQRGSFNNYDFDLSGGSEQSQYRISASYLKSQSIQKANDFEKFYLRLRLDNQLHPKFKMGISLAPTITKKNALNLYSNVPLIPNVPAYDYDGSFYEPARLVVPNPLAILAQNTAFHEGGSLNGNINFEYTPIKKVKIATNFGTDLLINKLNLFDSPKNATGRTKNGFAQIYDRTNFNWINFTQAAYTPIDNNQQKLEITAGFEVQSQYAKLLRGSGTGFTYYRLNELSNAQSQTAASSKQTSTSVAVYGQAQYNYLDKYFLNVSGRNDAASVFGTDVNSTINAAAGFGWAIHKEKFMQRVSWINNLHLKLSYGSTGNSRIGSYEARGLYTFGTTGYNNYTTAEPAGMPNPNLSWEKNNKFNAGLDIGIFNKFNIVIEWYKNSIIDGISPIDIAPQNGFTSILANIANMENKGMDISINTQNQFGKLHWSSTLNMGFNKNRITKVVDNGSIYSSNENATAIKAGSSTSAIWGFLFAGVDPATGVELFYDKNKAIVPVTSLDISIRNATNLGDRLPKLQGGFINTFTYKEFSLAVNTIFSVGGYQLVNYRNEWNGRNLDNRNQSVNLLNRWQKPGDITDIPRLSRTTRFVTNSSRYLYEDTYLKLSNITFSYIVPKKWTQKIRANRLTVFANATNLVYWYKGKSPSNRNGLAEYKFEFPEARSFTWGLKINF